MKNTPATIMNEKEICKAFPDFKKRDPNAGRGDEYSPAISPVWRELPLPGRPLPHWLAWNCRVRKTLAREQEGFLQLLPRVREWGALREFQKLVSLSR